MPAYAYAILAVGWAVWVIPFFLFKPPARTAEKRDLRARWGILLQAIAYSLLWQSPFWSRPLPAWRVPVSIAFLLISILFVWSGVRALGRQWRIDAGLNADHELVRSGPYSLVRHPIYTSMLCLLLGTGFLVTPLLLLLIAAAFLITGTEIRVRSEEKLLAARFGESFEDFRQSVPAYVPFLTLRRPTRAREVHPT
jgi:protein-S-isoprenylcysteine O-methyltransferase Ste14